MVGKAGSTFSKIATGVVRGALGSAITQGIGVATRLQSKFSWSSVAAGAVGGGVEGRFGTGLWSSIGGGIAGAAAASLVSGRDFGDTLISSLPSIIANTVGNALAGGGTTRGADNGTQPLTAANLPTTLGNAAAGEVLAVEDQHQAAVASESSLDQAVGPAATRTAAQANTPRPANEDTSTQKPTVGANADEIRPESGNGDAQWEYYKNGDVIVSKAPMSWLEKGWYDITHPGQWFDRTFDTSRSTQQEPYFVAGMELRPTGHEEQVQVGAQIGRDLGRSWGTPVSGTRRYIPSEIEMVRPEYAVGTFDVGTLTNEPMTRGEVTLGVIEVASILAPALKGGRIVPAAEGVGSAAFDSAGRLSRNGSRTVLNQGAAPTCGPTSVCMVLDTVGRQTDLGVIISQANVGKNGISMHRVASLLKGEGANASFVGKLSIDDLAIATSKGNPAIVAVRYNGGGHAVVVDWITTRQGARVVAIRDPHGVQYFETVSAFANRYLGQGVVVK